MADVWSVNTFPPRDFEPQYRLFRVHWLSSLSCVFLHKVILERERDKSDLKWGRACVFQGLAFGKEGDS
jgi:hypothetical protein